MAADCPHIVILAIGAPGIAGVGAFLRLSEHTTRSRRRKPRDVHIFAYVSRAAEALLFLKRGLADLLRYGTDIIRFHQKRIWRSRPLTELQRYPICTAVRLHRIRRVVLSEVILLRTQRPITDYQCRRVNLDCICRPVQDLFCLLRR